MSGKYGTLATTEQSGSHFQELSIRHRGEPSIGVPTIRSNDEFVSIEVLDPTAQALEACEKWVLGPCRGVLKALGWIGFVHEGDTGRQRLCLLYASQWMLVALWFALLVTVSVTQVLTCFRRDTSPPGFHLVINNSDGMTESVIGCDSHLISHHLILDLLLYFSYAFGIYLFSKGEKEYLSNLADKVFIKCYQAQLNEYSKKLTYTMGIYLVLAIVYVALSLIVRCLAAYIKGLYSQDLVIVWGNSSAVSSDDYGNPSFVIAGGTKITLVVISLLGFVFFDLVYLAAVINYAAQSELNIKLIYAIRTLVMQRNYENIDAAIQDVVSVRTYLNVLNGKTATAVALILFNLGAASFNSLYNLPHDDFTSASVALDAIVSGVNFLLWFLLFAFPFVQAARVSYACMRLKDTGPEIRARPLQYRSSTQLDLDSFVTLTNSIRIQAEIFGVPIYPWMMYLALVVFLFIMLIFFQTNVIAYARYV